MAALPSYAVGTVSIANGATSVVGTGTVWSGVAARAGDILVVAGHITEIVDVVDGTHLTIPEWPWGSQSDASYVIIQKSPLRFAGGQAMADVSKLLALLNDAEPYYNVPADATEPDVSLGEDGQKARQRSTGKEWEKVDGAWVLTGIYANMSWVDGWDAEAFYGVRTVLTHLGKLWISKRENTGVEPGSSAADWAVFYPFPVQSSMTVVFDAGGSEIAAGSAIDIPVGVMSIIRRVRMRADGIGSLVLDIRRKAFADGVPGAGDSICGSAKPHLTNARDYVDATLTGWSPQLDDDDGLRLVVESCAGLTRLSVTLYTDRIFT
ncbi:hypothetical protein [Rhodopseudomonas telluris]|uniref:Minor tail protein n=1 Tax=Rhodopseudomonas telluris TaxID=644215 RepID=A0ABV6EZM7_9BRAD